MANVLLTLFILYRFAAASPTPLGPRAAALPPRVSSVVLLGDTTSNFPNIYRDGGGGGKINGLNFMIFSDGLYTSGGVPAANNANLVNFTSNSIACSNCDGKGITSLQDFGTTQKGPLQSIPYYYNNGEGDFITAIWPNQGIATLCNGICGVSFPQVVNRTALSANQPADLYNTGIQIGLTAFGPVVSRPTQALFRRGEPAYGTFGTLVGIDGYLYMYAQITHTASSNGLKMARVPQGSWADRSQYRYWDGNTYVTQMPAYDDGGKANIFNYSQTAFGSTYGPGTGDLFFSAYYGVYMILFAADDPALDPSIYLTYSSDMTRGWSAPQAISKMTTLDSGYSYSFHAYPNYDPTGKVIPLSWSRFGTPSTYLITMANVTFA